MRATLGTASVYVSELRDNHQHDFVEHRYLDRDGAELQPVGRAPYHASMQVGFIGDDWLTSYNAVYELWKSAESFGFTNPRTGKVFRVKITRFVPTHSTRILNGTLATLDLAEDNVVTAGLVVTAAGVPGAKAALDESISNAIAALGELV